MRIVGVGSPGTGELVRLVVGHGQHPHQLLWRRGLAIGDLLSAQLEDGEVVITARVHHRHPGSRPPRIRHRGIDPDLAVAPAELPVDNQRIAAYAVVRSSRGVLGTECSDKTAVPGLWQLPGGGLNPGESPSEALIREVAEEVGLVVTVGAPFLVNEFHDPVSGYHQVDLFFRADLVGGDALRLEDPEGVVNRARWVTRDELAGLRHKPDSLGGAVWGVGDAIYDPLEVIVA